MKQYFCIFSKYDDSEFVAIDLKTDFLDYHTSVKKKIMANSLKEAFEKCVKENDIDKFWDNHGTIHPFYIDKKNTLTYYHNQFNLY